MGGNKTVFLEVTRALRKKYATVHGLSTRIVRRVLLWIWNSFISIWWSNRVGSHCRKCCYFFQQWSRLYISGWVTKQDICYWSTPKLRKLYLRPWHRRWGACMVCNLRRYRHLFLWKRCHHFRQLHRHAEIIIWTELEYSREFSWIFLFSTRRHHNSHFQSLKSVRDMFPGSLISLRSGDLLDPRSNLLRFIFVDWPKSRAGLTLSEDSRRTKDSLMKGISPNLARLIENSDAELGVYGSSPIIWPIQFSTFPCCAALKPFEAWG